MVQPTSTRAAVCSPEGWQTRSTAALQWAARSIAATGNLGSAHSYSPLFGWAKAYPETTGYLIETLLHYAQLQADDSLRRLAFQCGDWLCSIQLPDGAFTGKLTGHREPSVFNTAQILFGLLKLDEKTLAEEKNNLSSSFKYRNALARAAEWLMHLLESDGAWRQAAYRPGFVPSYYTRAVWGTLLVAKHLGREDWTERLRSALKFYALRFEADGTVRDWGFRAGRVAFTHTISYTLEGFFESSLILQEKNILERAVASADALLAARRKAGRTAGGYGAAWKGDYTFSCPAGTAQLSIFYYRLWQHTRMDIYRAVSLELLMEALASQHMGKNRDAYGALPGSVPFWGPYLRFRYPNWGAKFLLDALANWTPGTI